MPTSIATAAIPLPDRYRLEAILKETPQTAVYKVLDLADKREEAIKILRHEFSEPREVLQFKSEFATLVTLNHPSIIRVYDFGFLEEKYPYFTMEYFSGKKITEFFGGQNWEALYDVILQLASALHHIHTSGILHLDLKPSNILVDDSGRVKIMDFGVAAESRQLLDRTIRGTLHYMAPEVLRQDRTDVRADLYGLGMTLYETVTGALPTYGRLPIEIIRFHLDEEIRRPSAINPNIPERLEKIILKLLEKDPRHRYPSAAALLHDAAAAAGVAVSPAELLVGTGELLAAPLVGRDREVRAVLDVIDRAREGNGGGILVSGAEGMGKSRIVREATLRAQLNGARVFCGRCPVNRKSIYAPFFEIFQQMLSAVNPSADAAVEIRRLLRPIGTGNEGKPLLGQKFTLYNRIVQSLQDFFGFLNAVGSTTSPLVLVIEDLQWADPATPELFTFLVGEARHSNLVVIGTITTPGREAAAGADQGSAGSPLDWEKRASDAGIPLLRVEPLEEQDVEEYVESLLGAESLPHEFIRWLLWESAGAPLHIRRVIDYLIARGYLRAAPAGWLVDMERIHGLRIPGGAGAIWSEKLARLEPAQHELLETAAVLGERFDLATLTAVSHFPPEDTYRLANELIAAGLLEASSDGGVFWFPQMSFRETVYVSTSEPRRAEMHQRAAQVLEETFTRGASELLGQTAYHYARGTDPRKAVDYSIQAGAQAAAALSHEQAAEFYRAALELMDLTGDDDRKPEIRERLGDAYYRSRNFRGAMQVYQFLLKSTQTRTGDPRAHRSSARIMMKVGKVLAKRAEFDAALSYYQSALQTFEEDGDAALDRAEILNRMAWIHKDKGDLPEAARIAEEAQKLVESVPLAPIHGYVCNTLGAIALARGDWDAAQTHFGAGLPIAEELGSEQLRKLTRSNLGEVLWKLGDWDGAIQAFRANLEQSEKEGDLWDLASAYTNVAAVEFSRGNFHAAANLLDKSIRVDEKLASPENEAVALERLGEALEMIGRWPEALDRYRRCESVAGFDEQRPSRVSVYVPFARLTAKMGDVARALQLVHKAYDVAERTRDEDLMAEAAFVLAQIDAARENYEPAHRYLDEARQIFESRKAVHGVARVDAFAAELAAREQKIDDARELAGRASAVLTRLGDRFTQAVVDRTLSRLAFMQGDRDAGEARFSAAHAVFDELDTPYELGRLLFDTGVLREEPDEAGQLIRRAVRTFEHLQAAPDLERARGALFRIKPSSRPGEAGVVGLYEIVKIINSTLSVEEVLTRVLDIALRRLRAERGMIILIDPITGALRTRVARNIKDGEGESEGSKRSPQSIIREVVQSGHSVISADARADERFTDSESVISENVVSTLCVPLVIRARISGAIYVDHRQTRHLFSQKDLNFLEAFADQAAIAIENARLYEELEEARVRLSTENESLRKEVLFEKHLDSVVGSSEAVAKIQFAIRKAAASTSTVLVRGESGTGKGLVARIIHNVGPRRNGPFIKFNCAALPETLAESELFGHEKGAFTGAERRKLGRFELANGGTIFLDEIGKVSLAIQSKLLRVVEDKEFERVGGTQTIKTDAKIIAATNLDLERAIEDGTFREDLYYRLNIIPLNIPPLRERKDDIPALVEHFIKKICRDLGIDQKRLEPGILELFDAYDWPGNIRELEATLHRAIVMSSSDVLTRVDFYSLLSDPHKTISDAPISAMPPELLNPLVKRMQLTSDVYDDILARVDRQLIRQALEETGGKIRETARRLGLARNTLRAKLQKYDLAPADRE